MNLGTAISNIRKAKGKTQGVLAEEAELTQAYLSQIESNKKEPNLSSLKKISKVLEVPLPIIFFLALDDEDIPKRKQQAYQMLSPSIKSFIQEFFLSK